METIVNSKPRLSSRAIEAHDNYLKYSGQVATISSLLMLSEKGCTLPLGMLSDVGWLIEDIIDRANDSVAILYKEAVK